MISRLSKQFVAQAAQARKFRAGRGIAETRAALTLAVLALASLGLAFSARSPSGNPRPLTRAENPRTLSPAQANDENSPAPTLSPDEELRTFTVQPGFHVELVAAEPMICAPVAMSFDGEGRLWVVEMPTYMPDVAGTNELTPANRITVLEDTDGDGTMDKATPFLEGLVLPRGVLPCFGGALVIEPPNILFCKDNDGDGRADEKRVLLEGIGGRDNPEHAPNGLIWGMDNWISFSQHTQRFRFDGLKVTTETTPGHGQWGVTIDDTGRLFYTPNSDTLRGDIFPKQYASRNPNQRTVAGMNEKIGLDLAVWPARVSGVNRGYLPNFLRSNRRLANVTAACSPSIYRGTAFPEEFWGDAFVCEPSGNLVKRLAMREYNGVPIATNAYEGDEFLTSTDERFRPVASCVGPDGSLYLADMYRGVIQHRVFLTPFLKEHIAKRGLDAPLNCGRIYRVVADKLAPRLSTQSTRHTNTRPRLSSMSDAELVTLLSHSDGWWRDAAQRTLVQRRATAVAPRLRELAADSPDSRARLHALWTLDGLDASEPGDAHRAIADPQAAVRAAGLRIAEHWIGNLETLDRVIAAASDTDRLVRIQAALSVSRSGDSRATQMLVEMLRDEGGDSYIRSAVLTGIMNREPSVLAALRRDDAWPASPGDHSVLADLVDCGLRSASGDVRTRTLEQVTEDAAKNPQRAERIMRRVREELRIGKEGSRVLSLTREPTDWLRTIERTSASGDRAVAKAGASMRTITGYLDWPGRPTEGLPALVRALTSEEQAQFERGAKLYAACAGCHGPDGRGTAAQIPPLAGSPRVLGPADRLAKILLLGLEGKVESGGVVYDGAMPAAPMRSDDELAAVMTYLRRGWGNTAEPVSAKIVAEAKAATADRKLPWKLSELEGEGAK